MLICFLMMLCIWPFCLVRKEKVETSNLNVKYAITEQRITQEAPLRQTFIAQTSRLEKIQVVLGVDSDAEIALDNGALLFELLDPDGKTVFDSKIDFAKMEWGSFYTVPIHQWIRAGQEYTFKISVEEIYDDLFYGIYTTEPEEHAIGSLTLSIGDVLIEGQSLAGYGYGYPLNIKNVLCLWGGILAIGFSLCNIVAHSNEGRLRSRKVQVLLNKLDMLLSKYSGWILILEALLILVMLAFISRNKAVDWDEAYSIRMITKYSFVEMFEATAEDIHPPLYYVVLRLVSMLFGANVFTLKLVSVAFTGLVMLLSITKVRKWWGGYAAFFFNLAVGLGAQFAFYSVNIRMYSMSLFFVTWCALLAYGLIRGEGGRNWVLFTLAALGGAYTHYFNVVPLAFICGYLLVGLLVTRKEDCKKFWGVCAGIVLGYLPWLPIVFSSFQREGVSGQIDFVAGNLQEMFAWAFSTNIKFSEWTPLVLFAVAVILWLLEWKKICVQNRLFLGMCALNLVFSYVVCRIIASMNQHFWTERYVFAALGTFWLFLAICYSRRGRLAQVAMLVWLSITVLSAFTIVKAREMETTLYMDATYQVLEQVRGEGTVLYNYDTYDVLYGAHLREQEFVFIDDFDWGGYEKDYVYLISWGGHMFDDEVVQRYGLELTDCGTMRFEEGVAGVKLYKVCRNAGK